MGSNIIIGKFGIIIRKFGIIIGKFGGLQFPSLRRSHTIHRDRRTGSLIRGVPAGARVKIEVGLEMIEPKLLDLVKDVQENIPVSNPVLGLSHVQMFQTLKRQDPGILSVFQTPLKIASAMERGPVRSGANAPPIDGLLCLTKASLQDPLFIFEEIAQCIWWRETVEDSSDGLPIATVGEFFDRVRDRQQQTVMPRAKVIWKTIRCHSVIYEAMQRSETYRNASAEQRREADQRRRRFRAVCSKADSANGPWNCRC